MTRTVVLFLVLALSTTPAAAAELFVAPNGTDSNPGTIERPFATLEAARDAVRQLKASGVREDVTVWIRGGVYRLRETVVFSLEDSAPEGHRVTYAAYGGEEPIFTSGVRIGGWKRIEVAPAGLPSAAEGNVWVADVPEARGGGWRFRTLYDGERMLPRARSKGFRPTKDSLVREKRWTDLNTLHFPERTLRNWENLEDVEIFIIPNHVWIVNYLGLASVDETNNVAKTSVPGTYALHHFKGALAGDSCWVENVPEALDEPGEWMLNTREGKLYLWPESGRPGETIFAPRLRELIRVEGTCVDALEGDVPVRGLVFKGLTLTCGDRDVWTTEDKGLQHDWEMWDKGNALLRLRGAQDCTVEHCDLRNSGGGGVRLDRYAQNIRIAGNNVHDLGGTGVLLCGYGPGLKDVNKRNLIANNNIQTCSQLHWHNPGIFVWQSGENRILNNRVHNLPYDGIVLSGVRPRYFGITDPVKWTQPDVIPLDIRENMPTIRWDECGKPKTAAEARRFAHARDNLVQDNELNDCMQTLADGNAIYLSCAGEGNVIRRNLIYNCPRAATQLRFDDDQEGSTIEKNVVFGPGIKLKHNNNILNNVLIDGAIVFRKEVQSGSKIERNILYNRADTVEFYGGGEKLFTLTHPDRNLFYSPDEAAGRAFVARLKQLGIEGNGRFADPLFVDLEHFDLRLKPGSPALKMGIEPIDTEKIGLLDDPAFARLRKQGLVSTGDGSKLAGGSSKH